MLFAGLPGAGKSSVAEAVGRALHVPVFAKDWLEATLVRCGYRQQGEGAPALGLVGYELLTTLAERQLQLGQSVILDSVASTEAVRERWRGLGASHNARWRVIECVCSDEGVHRARLTTRARGIPGWHELDWAEVERVRSYYAPWREGRLVLDAVRPLSENVALALQYVHEGGSALP